MQFTAVLEDSLYKQKAIFVDIDDDNTCSAPDALFFDDRGPRADLTINLNPQSQWNTLGDCTNIARDWPTE